MSFPQATWGSIGGSATWAIRFPEDLDGSTITVVDQFEDGFETPYGRTAPFKLLDVDGRRVLRVAFHGMPRDNTEPVWVRARQIVHVFELAGVRRVLIDGSVGGVQSPASPGSPISPWSIVIASDMIQHWPTPGAGSYKSDVPLPRMRRGFCPSMRREALRAAERAADADPRLTVYPSGVHVVMPFDRFETPAEIEMVRRWGGHVVGQTLGHQLPLLKRAGMHVAAINVVSNYAEGHEHWTGDDTPSALADFYWACSPVVGAIVSDTLQAAVTADLPVCDCNDYHNTGLDKLPIDGA